MTKPIFTLLLIFNTLLFAEQELNSDEIIDLSSAFQIESNLSKIDEPIFNSYKDAVKIAKVENKKILLEIVADNCKFCEKMRIEVLSKESVKEAINKDFVFAQANADRETLPLALDEQMSPMFVFVSQDGNIMDMRLGYVEEKLFLELLKEQSKK
jgi:thioredoxin-related protein